MFGKQHDLSAKLARLITAAGDPSSERLAEAITEHTGTSISGAYLWQLKKGKRANLTLQHLMALSSYFSSILSVPITLSYFDPGTPEDEPWRVQAEADTVARLREQLAEEQRLSAALTDRGVRRIAARYGSMDPAEQRQLLAIVETFAHPGPNASTEATSSETEPPSSEPPSSESLSSEPPSP